VKNLDITEHDPGGSDFLPFFAANRDVVLCPSNCGAPSNRNAVLPPLQPRRCFCPQP
jgi:hypothetical protein